MTTFLEPTNESKLHSSCTSRDGSWMQSTWLESQRSAFFEHLRVVKAESSMVDMTWVDFSRQPRLSALSERSNAPGLAFHLGEVWSRWKNNYRYVGDERLRVEIKRLQLDRGLKGDSLKENARIVVEIAFEIVNKGTFQWTKR